MTKSASLSKGAAGKAGANLLSVREAAAALGIHEHTLRGWVRKGIIHAMHLPGSNYNRFRPEEISRVQMLMEDNGEKCSVRIEHPDRDPKSLEEAHRLHAEILEEFAKKPPEDTLEDAMTRLRGRAWSS